MSSLNLKMEGSEGSRVNDETFKILRDYLQPGSSMTMKSAASALLGLLPEDAPFSTDVWVFGEMCLEVAEQIHYSHPSQMKLAALLEYLGRFKQLGYVVSISNLVIWALLNLDSIRALDSTLPINGLENLY